MKLIYSLVDKNNEIKFMMPFSPTAVSLRWHRAVERQGLQFSSRCHHDFQNLCVRGIHWNSLNKKIN